MSASPRASRRLLRLRRSSEPPRTPQGCLAEVYGLLCPLPRPPEGETAAKPVSPRFPPAPVGRLA